MLLLSYEIVCFIATRNILITSVGSAGIYISVVNSSRRNVLKQGPTKDNSA
jgi:hypothetical protein